MTVRLIEGEKPYTAGDGIDISTDKVISVLLREENNLIHLNSNNELYTDLQIVAGAKPTDDFEVGVTTGRVLESDGRPHTGTLLHYETTSGDYCQWLYGTDTNLYFDGGDGNWRQVYYSDQANEIFMRWMDFYRQTKTGNSITLDLNTEYEPTGDFTVNAPSTIKEGQTYILRVNNGATVYTMTLGDGINNIQGTNINLTPNATDMFVFLAIDGILELQKEIPEGTKVFFVDGYFDNIATVGAEMAQWLNDTEQTLDSTTYKDAMLIVMDNDNLVHDRIAHIREVNGLYRISFATRTRIENNYADGTSSNKMYMVRMNFSYTGGVRAYDSYEDTQLYTTEKYLRADYDYATPYTPLYNGSPATKKYVDDIASGKQDALVSGTNIKTINSTSLLGSGDISVLTAETVVSGNSGTTYTIKVAHSDPSGVTNNVITFVTPLLEYSELIALNNADAIVNELNSDALGYFNKYLQELHIGEDVDPELVRPTFYYLEDNGVEFTIDGHGIYLEDGTTEWHISA